MTLNGRELKITPAAFKDAMALQKSIGKAIKGTKLNIDEKDLMNSDLDITEIINSIIAIGISDEVEDALFVCAGRALLGNDKIDSDFFEVVENREYYYQIMIEIIKVNLSPFFKGLLSQFSAIRGSLGNTLKPK